MPRVALVFPYYRTKSATELLFPPLGAASLAAQLGRLGIERRIFDCTFASPRQIRDALAHYRPEIVGIYSMISHTQNAFEIAEMIRASSQDSLIVAGGPLPTLYPGRYSSPFDAVFRGEADLSFPHFCRDFFDQKVTRATLAELPLDSYEGLFISNPAGPVDNPSVNHAESVLRSFPLPDRSDFDHVAYQQASLEKGGTKTASIITSFGCPFGCDFCSKPIFGNLFRRRDLDAVFEEVGQVRGLGYDDLWIADDNFTLDLHHLEQFCERATGAGMTWSCLSRASGIDEQTARQMKAAGCRRVYLGLESGAPATLRLMEKRVTVEEGIHTVSQYRAAGIEVAAFFIVGYPGETTTSIEETFKLALALPLDEISFNVPYPLPGSKLFDRVGSVDASRDWSKENEISFVYPSEFDEGWLRRRIEETMASFSRNRGRRSGS